MDVTSLYHTLQYSATTLRLLLHPCHISSYSVLALTPPPPPPPPLNVVRQLVPFLVEVKLYSVQYAHSL
jgi:hypothetical protein